MSSRSFLPSPWFLIVASIVVALAVGFFYVTEWAPEPLYESTARVLVERPQEDSSEVPILFAESESYPKAQAVLIMSRQVLSRAMNDPNLLTLKGAADPNYMSNLIKSFSADAGEDTGIIRVTATAPYAKDAAKLVNAVVRAYRKWHWDSRALGAADTLHQLNDQLSKYREELDEARHRRGRFEERLNDAVSDPNGYDADKLALVKQERAKAYLAVEEARLYYDGLQRHQAEPQKFRQFVRTYQDQSSEAAAQATASAEETNASDEAFVQNCLSLAKTSVQDAEIRMECLDELYGRLSPGMVGARGMEGQYRDIVAECDMLSNLCDRYFERITRLKITLPEGPRIHVLEEAIPASVPVKSNFARNTLGLAALVGLIVGVVLAIIAKRSRTS